MAERDFWEDKGSVSLNVDLSGNKAHEAVLGSPLLSVYKLTAEVKAPYSCHTGGLWLITLSFCGEDGFMEVG